MIFIQYRAATNCYFHYQLICQLFSQLIDELLSPSQCFAVPVCVAPTPSMARMSPCPGTPDSNDELRQRPIPLNQVC